MAYGESNGHVTDDVTWPQKVKTRDPNVLRAQYLKTAGDAVLQQSLITVDSLLWGSTVSYPSNSLASCLPSQCYAAGGGVDIGEFSGVSSPGSVETLLVTRGNTAVITCNVPLSIPSAPIVSYLRDNQPLLLTRKYFC